MRPGLAESIFRIIFHGFRIRLPAFPAALSCLTAHLFITLHTVIIAAASASARALQRIDRCACSSAASAAFLKLCSSHSELREEITWILIPVAGKFVLVFLEIEFVLAIQPYGEACILSGISCLQVRQQPPGGYHTGTSS